MSATIPALGWAPGAALVSLGDVTVASSANLTVRRGTADINGTLSGPVTATRGINQPAGVTDPLAPYLPTSVVVPPHVVNGTTCNITTPLARGTYNCKLVVGRGGDGYAGPSGRVPVQRRDQRVRDAQVLGFVRRRVAVPALLGRLQPHDLSIRGLSFPSSALHPTVRGGLEPEHRRPG